MTADNLRQEVEFPLNNDTGSPGGLRAALSPENIRNFLESSRSDLSANKAAFDTGSGLLNFNVPTEAPSKTAVPARVATAGDLRIATAGVGAELSFSTPGTAQESARDALISASEQHIKSPHLRASFQKDIAAFEERARIDKVDPAEVKQTLENVKRLFDLPPRGSVPQDRGAQLAREVMRQAANPARIDQGDNLTCNVTTVENLIYSKQPGVAAKLVADVATTGSYTAQDGTKVRLDRQSLRPDREAQRSASHEGDRTYATQLFNLASINLHYQKHKPNYRYEIHPPKDGKAGGERLLDYSKKPAALVKDCNGPVNQPYLLDDEIVGVYETISGKNSKDVYLAHKDNTDDESSKKLTKFKSESELRDKLLELKGHGKLPAILAVNTAIEPFYSDSGRGNPKQYSGSHVVVIRDVEPGPPAKVAVDNQMGSKVDHLGSGMLSLKTLYLSSLPTPKAISHLEKEIKAERKHGVRDQKKAAELARLRTFTPAKGCPE